MDPSTASSASTLLGDNLSGAAIAISIACMRVPTFPFAPNCSAARARDALAAAHSPAYVRSDAVDLDSIVSCVSGPAGSQVVVVTRASHKQARCKTRVRNRLQTIRYCQRREVRSRTSWLGRPTATCARLVVEVERIQESRQKRLGCRPAFRHPRSRGSPPQAARRLLPSLARLQRPVPSRELPAPPHQTGANRFPAVCPFWSIKDTGGKVVLA
jgi:hypothetical protein